MWSFLGVKLTWNNRQIMHPTMIHELRPIVSNYCLKTPTFVLFFLSSSTLINMQWIPYGPIY